MESLLDKLGVDWKLLLAQAINFLILLAILYKFLYKPVLKTLHDREEKIDNSLKQAERIEENLFKSEAEKAKIIAEARNEAGRIIAEGKDTSDKMRDELVNTAKIEATNALEQGKKQLAIEKEQMFKELKGEVADMVTVATEKILRNKIDGNLDKKTIEENIKEL
ncbi:MAG: ATP synthase F0 subunit B [Parcubacteria group bacterium CG10_big_fil_rev_8_21_14_0_10_36_14]|nr:MAG: ATP synthase F0 subunit B [Parcubacteria group bacterium CG10_big_fil_rev_8_21_14_0_10_36_14]